MADSLKFYVRLFDNSLVPPQAVDALALTLSNDSVNPTYGLKLIDSDQILVGPNIYSLVGGQIIRESEGVYFFQYDNPIDGDTYEAVFQVTAPDGAILNIPVRRTAGIEPSCVLFDFASFQRRFGVKNVLLVSDLEKARVPDLIRIQEAFDFCVAEIYKQLRGGPYIIPFDWSDNGGSVDPAVAEWGKVIAYSWLYYGRFEDNTRILMADGTSRVNQLAVMVSKLQKSVYLDMNLAKMGTIQIAAKQGVTSAFDQTPLIVTHQDILLASVNLWNYRWPDAQPIIAW